MPSDHEGDLPETTLVMGGSREDVEQYGTVVGRVFSSYLIILFNDKMMRRALDQGAHLF